MLKFLPLVIVICIITAASGYFVFFASKPKPSPPVVQPAIDQLKQTTQLTASSEAEKIKLLTAAILELKSQLDEVKQANKAPAVAFNDTTEEITSLEDRVVNLQTQVTQLAAASTTGTTTSTSSTKSPVVYIPLGVGGQSIDLNWLTLVNYGVQINPADYPGYSSMQLEVNFNLEQASGTGYARLFNVTDSSDAGISVQTTITTPQWYQSYFFKPATGSKTYALQVKSATGTQIYVQSARIRVNF